MNSRCCKSQTFNHLKRGNVRKKVSSPYIKSKEVSIAGRTKKPPQKNKQASFFVVLLFVVARCANAPHLPCYAMKEKMEILRSLAEAILDEVAEMEVVLIEDAKVLEDVGCSVIDN